MSHSTLYQLPISPSTMSRSAYQVNGFAIATYEHYYMSVIYPELYTDSYNTKYFCTLWLCTHTVVVSIEHHITWNSWFAVALPHRRWLLAAYTRQMGIICANHGIGASESDVPEGSIDDFAVVPNNVTNPTDKKTHIKINALLHRVGRLAGPA